MENLRTFLFASLAMVLFLMYQAWQEDYPQEVVQTTNEPVAADAINSDIPSAPAIATSSDTPAASELPTTNGVARPVSKGKRIQVITDVYDLQIDTQGGDIKQVLLTNYPKSVDVGAEPLNLMENGKPHLFVSQSGLLGGGPDHSSAIYSTASNSFAMQEGSDALEVVLSWQNVEGLKVDKVYTFHRGRYDVDLEYRVNNASAKAWQGSMYRQFKRSENTGVKESKFLVTYTGGVLSTTDEPYEKIDFGDIEDANLDRSIKGGWVAMIQHYFVAAWIADEKEDNRAYTKFTNDKKYVIGMITPNINVASGAQQNIKTQLFVGPKLQEQLNVIAPNLNLTVDYGWLTILAKPVYWWMNVLYGFLGNWGWAIIFVTLTIKILFFKLSEKSFKSMAKLRTVTPRLKELKERYGDNKQEFQKAMMKIYQEEKINPLGGCLPILVQIPVFIALYWVLLESVELRQASFIWWLNDLSIPDPYYILPILMGASMVIQQRLNPAPMDPVQQKVMMMLPLIFGVFFAFFPAGLVLYWVANNILSISQQWYITRSIEAK